MISTSTSMSAPRHLPVPPPMLLQDGPTRKKLTLTSVRGLVPRRPVGSSTRMSSSSAVERETGHVAASALWTGSTSTSITTIIMSLHHPNRDPTSAGKTLIFEYVMKKDLATDSPIIPNWSFVSALGLDLDMLRVRGRTGISGATRPLRHRGRRRRKSSSGDTDHLPTRLHRHHPRHRPNRSMRNCHRSSRDPRSTKRL